MYVFWGKEFSGTNLNFVLFITVCYILVCKNYLGKYWIQRNTTVNVLGIILTSYMV